MVLLLLKWEVWNKKFEISIFKDGQSNVTHEKNSKGQNYNYLAPMENVILSKTFYE